MTDDTRVKGIGTISDLRKAVENLKPRKDATSKTNDNKEFSPQRLPASRNEPDVFEQWLRDAKEMKTYIGDDATSAELCIVLMKYRELKPQLEKQILNDLIRFVAKQVREKEYVDFKGMVRLDHVRAAVAEYEAHLKTEGK